MLTRNSFRSRHLQDGIAPFFNHVIVPNVVKQKVAVNVEVETTRGRERKRPAPRERSERRPRSARALWQGHRAPEQSEGMGSKERREKERTETRERILEAARELFVDKGVEAVTMREIARRIDYTPTAIYHHFQDKDALITELCGRNFLSLARLFLKIGRIEDPVERLRRIGVAYLDFALEHPGEYRFMFLTPKPVIDPTAAGVTVNNPEEDAYAFLRQAIAEGIAAGRYLPDYHDADLVAQIMWGGVHGIAALHIIKGHDAWVEWKDARETGKLLIDGLIRGATRDA